MLKKEENYNKKFDTMIFFIYSSKFFSFFLNVFLCVFYVYERVNYLCLMFSNAQYKTKNGPDGVCDLQLYDIVLLHIETDSLAGGSCKVENLLAFGQYSMGWVFQMVQLYKTNYSKA